MTARTTLALVQGEPRTFPLTLTATDPATGVEAGLDVTEVALSLHVHERDSDDPALDPIPVLPLSPNVVGRGSISFTAEQVGDLLPTTPYVGRIRKADGESLDAVDIAVHRAWR